MAKQQSIPDGIVPDALPVQEVDESLIACERNGVVQYFTQELLDRLGKSKDGSYDGWTPLTD